MKFIYNSKSLPPLAPEVLQKLDAAAARLTDKVMTLNPAKMALTDDGKQSVVNYQSEPDSTMIKYLYLLAWSLYPAIASNKELVFVDHGGGPGLMSCFAREAGLGTVIYNDIWEPWCRDAKVLAQHLGCAADNYICGDIPEVVRELKPLAGRPFALVSVNVIEHVFDIEDFLRTAAGLSSKAMVMVLSTSANPLNPLVRRRHHAHHREWEFQDGPHEGFMLMQEARAFYKVRQDLVKEAGPSLDEVKVAALAAATRGMRRDGIENCVAQFLQTGRITAQPEHPTNTCDPMTGNWEERLLNIPAVSDYLKSLGFDVRIAGGYYDGKARAGAKRVLKKFAARILNHAISRLGTQGAKLAPCFMFHAVRK